LDEFQRAIQAEAGMQPEQTAKNGIVENLWGDLRIKLINTRAFMQ
jgi:hypothetical protein